MHPDAEKELVAYFEELEQLIAAGELPDVPGVWDRIAYLGHEVIHVYGTIGENAIYRCVKCKADFNGHDGVCPSCHSNDDSFQINKNRSARWRCKVCKHEWDGEEGHTCPTCGKVEGK